MNIIKQFESVFSKIYGKETAILEAQYKRYNQLTKNFKSHFEASELHYFSTPGRTEIGGNHTDHNHGRVLAGSVSLDSIAVAALNDENKIRLYSEGFEGIFDVDLNNLNLIEEEKGTTHSLIRGIAARFKELGYQIGGFNACMTSDVLSGSGLSSSASVEVLIGTIFSALFNNNKINPEELAIIGQYAENNFFGKPCGLMDQVACALGGIVTIDFKNPAEPIIKKVNFDFAAQNYNLIVVNTGGSHADLTDDYASVPAEMKSVAKHFKKEVCRELSMDDLMSNIRELRSATGDRALLRAIHFIGENERVTKQVNALEENDFKLFLTLIKESGDSSYKRLQNIYSNTNSAEQGVSLALALSEYYINLVEEGACRVHGGGFAGTIQVFLPSSLVKNYIKLMENVYGENSVYLLNIRPLGTLYLNEFLR